MQVVEFSDMGPRLIETEKFLEPNSNEIGSLNEQGTGKNQSVCLCIESCLPGSILWYIPAVLFRAEPEILS